MITALWATLFFIPWSGFDAASGKLYDLSLKLRGGKSPPPEVVVVAIDDSSIQQIGRWPWPRKHIAQLIDRLSSLGVRAIALDLIFPPAEDEVQAGHDRMLAEAIGRAGNVVGAYYFQMGRPQEGAPEIKLPPAIMNSAFLLFDDPQKFQESPPPIAQAVFLPVPEIAAQAKALGHITLLPDPDGIVRREPLIIAYGGNYFPCFTLQVTATAYGLSRTAVSVKVGQSIRLGRWTIPTTPDGMRFIPYYGGPGTIPHYSCAQVLSGQIEKEKLQGRIAFVGVTASGLASGIEDSVSTPLARRMPAVEKHAQSAASIIEGRFLVQPPWTSNMEWALVFILGVILTLTLPRLQRSYALFLPLAVLLGLGFLLVALLFQGIWFPLLFPIFLGISFFLWSLMRLVLQGHPQPVPFPEPSSIGGKPRIQPASDDPTVHLPVTPAPGSRRLGRYEILEEIGQGGMGVVYRGHDPLNDRPVAIKTIRFDRLYGPAETQQNKERFFAEVRAAGKLIHPYIATIFDVGEEGETAYIAMEYVAGTTLAHHTTEGKLLPVEEILQLGLEAAQALDFAHRQGIIHRDVKPSNLMRTLTGQAKVMDFGIAKLPTSMVTPAGSILGSPSYMSPEQIQGGPIDGRSDLFSLGCVLYELLTGAKPFPGEDFISIAQKIEEEDPLAPSQKNPRVPARCDAIILKALAKGREKRFPNGQEMARALMEALRILKP